MGTPQHDTSKAQQVQWQGENGKEGSKTGCPQRSIPQHIYTWRLQQACRREAGKTFPF